MFEIQDDNKIFLTRGDTGYLSVNLMEDDEPYVLQTGDVVRFAMKFKYSDSECLIKKNLYLNEGVDNSMILHIEPEDTKELQFKKNYVYDIELKKANGDTYTFIKGTLYLDEEVD